MALGCSDRADYGYSNTNWVFRLTKTHLNLIRNVNELIGLVAFTFKKKRLKKTSFEGYDILVRFYRKNDIKSSKTNQTFIFDMSYVTSFMTTLRGRRTLTLSTLLSLVTICLVFRNDKMYC